MENVINAAEFGFLPENSAEKNSEALNNAVKNGGEVHIDIKGTYEVSETVMLKSNTTIVFGEGVIIKRIPSKSENGYLFVNEGAYTRNLNENINIIGLNLICNGVQAEYREISPKLVPGLRGHISFFYVKNVKIDGFKTLDLPNGNFAVHVCTFENLTVENCVIEGDKDGVHLGRGKNFVIRNCRFKTFDDPIALNAHDYATSNPQLGWIENGVIENCIEEDDENTTGFFCRILCGAWVDWYKGMIVRHSDSVVSDGRVYRVLMKPDGSEYVSESAPCFEKGDEIIDGIHWVMVQEDATYNCGCRNIRFNDIYLKKKRDVAFSFHFDDDKWSHSYYKNAAPPIQSDIVFEKIHLENRIPELIHSVTPMNDIKIMDSDLKDSVIVLDKIKSTAVNYPESNFVLENVKFNSFTEELIKCKNLRKTNVKYK